MDKLERERILQTMNEIWEEIRDGISSEECDESDHDNNPENFYTNTEQSSLSANENNILYDDDIMSNYSYYTSEDDLPLSEG